MSLLIKRSVPVWVFAALLGLAAAGVTVPYILWSLADTSAPVSEPTAPVAFDGNVQTPAVWVAGAWVYVWRYLQIHRQLPCLARRSLVSAAVVIRLPDVWEPFQAGADGKTPVHASTFQIPASLAPGLYQYQVTLDCELNPLKRITAPLRDVPLYVGTNPVLETVEERYNDLMRRLQEARSQLDQLDKYVKPQPHTRVPGPGAKDVPPKSGPKPTPQGGPSSVR